MKILLTGAAGFIGSHLAQRLCARGERVTGFDNFDAFYGRDVKQRNLAELAAPTTAARWAFVEGDITDDADLARAFAAAAGPDVVVHLAALAGVRPSIAQPLRYQHVNVTGTMKVLQACRARGVRRVVFASSSSVYGVGSEVPFRESDPCRYPASPYAATKRAGELVAFTAHHLDGLGITCLRFFTVYGPRQRPDLAIHKFTRLIDAGQPIPLFGDGSASRDYTFIDDIIDGVVAAVDQQHQPSGEGVYRVYNLGGSRTTTLLRLVELISDALGRKAKVQWLPDQPGDLRHTHADVALAGRDLGFSPKIGIEEGIARFAAWWKSGGGGQPTG